MSSSARPQGSRRGAQILSTLLFLIAIVFAGSAVYIWQFQDDPDDGAEAPRPTLPAEDEPFDQIDQVIMLFQNAGYDCKYAKSPPTAKTEQTGDTPGQHLTVDGQHVFVFIYTDEGGTSGKELADAVMEDVDPATMQLSTPSKADPADGQPLTVYHGANLIVVTYGGDEESNAKIQTVIEGLG